MSDRVERGNSGNAMLRIALIVLGIGIVLIIAGVISFFAYRASKDNPIAIKQYPGSELVNEEKLSDGEDHIQYRSNDSAEVIESFYSDAYDDLTCQRQYETVQNGANSETVREGYLFTRCRIDRSWLDMSQYVVLTIQPERDEANVLTGVTVIDIRRTWGG